jgi:ABC-type multidrug transport system ATPase subunit
MRQATQDEVAPDTASILELADVWHDYGGPPVLRGISLTVARGEFLTLLGPSGSGKSTLLAILSGRVPPDAGSVAVNGEDLFAHFEALKEDIAVVPQRDVLHDSLPLGAALRYTAELRLPPDLSLDEVRSSVADILGVVGLAHREGTPIRHLSGGQIKRASLANELVSRPSLLFLDEVTSGLDEQTDREVMELFREVADGGKTVVCITHNLANVEATCHLVVILAEGGRLAFVGTPDEAKAYFKVARLGDVYRTLARHEPAAWQARFRSSPYYRRYVAERLPSAGASADPPQGGSVRSRQGWAGSLRQAWVLTRRYLAIWKGDRQAMLAILGQALLVALLLGMVFGRLAEVGNPVDRVRRTVNLLLLLAVSSFWFGCNTSAKELVKERSIFLRERAYNLRVGAYLVSKLLVLTLIAVAQATLLFGIVRAWCGPGGMAASQWLVLASLAAAGTGVGLLISAVSRSEEVATALVPLAVIPQIVLGGVIAPLNGIAELFAKWSISVYWGQQGLERLIPGDDLALLGREDMSWSVPVAIVLAYAVVAWSASFVVLRRTRPT